MGKGAPTTKESIAAALCIVLLYAAGFATYKYLI